MKHLAGIVLLLVTIASFPFLQELGLLFEDGSQIEHGRYLILAIVLIPTWGLFLNFIYFDK